MPARRRSSGLTITSRTQSAVRKPRTTKVKPEINVAELREKLAGFRKSVDISITMNDLQGNIDAVMSNLYTRAERSGLDPHDVEIRQVRQRYDTRWILRGKRDFTDAEIKKEGPKLLKQKEVADERNAAQRDKDFATIQRLASKHGLPTPIAVSQVVDKRKK